MPNFVFTYRAPTGYTPSADSLSAWMSFFETMGDQVVEMGKPVIDRTSVGSCDPATTELGGYSVIQARDLDEALTLAKGCPFVDRRGGVEVGLLGEVPQLDAAS